MTTEPPTLSDKPYIVRYEFDITFPRQPTEDEMNAIGEFLAANMSMSSGLMHPEELVSEMMCSDDSKTIFISTELVG